MKNYTIFMLLTSALVVGMLALIARTRFEEFKAHHVAITQESAAVDAIEAARFSAE
jgi:hypothetical protein